MSCSGCQTRLTRMLERLGFAQAITGGWERRSARGKVLIDLKPTHHTRTALLALCVCLLQGRTG